MIAFGILFQEVTVRWGLIFAPWDMQQIKRAIVRGGQGDRRVATALTMGGGCVWYGKAQEKGPTIRTSRRVTVVGGRTETVVVGENRFLCLDGERQEPCDAIERWRFGYN